MKNIKHKLRIIVGISLMSSMLFSCQTKEKKKDSKAEFQGYIESTQVNVTTRMPGRILKIFVDEGDTLHQGDTVAILDTRELRAHREALIAKLNNIKLNKGRLEELYSAGAVPLQKLDAINTGYDMLMANLKAIDIKIQDMTITAPMDGIVNVKVLEPNQMMPPGMPVVIETDPHGTWARFGIPETYLNQVNLGQKLKIQTNTKGLTLTGKVIQLLPMASFATHTPTTLRSERDIRTFDIKVLILDNQTKCKPGMSVFLTLDPKAKN